MSSFEVSPLLERRNVRFEEVFRRGDKLGTSTPLASVYHKDEADSEGEIREMKEKRRRRTECRDKQRKRLEKTKEEA